MGECHIRVECPSLIIVVGQKNREAILMYIYRIITYFIYFFGADFRKSFFLARKSFLFCADFNLSFFLARKSFFLARILNFF